MIGSAAKDSAIACPPSFFDAVWAWDGSLRNEMAAGQQSYLFALSGKGVGGDGGLPRILVFR